jgi:SAM-dependent methyltransferase
MFYGKYILNTGEGILRLELAMGNYLYQTRFKGKAPILDVGAGRCWFTKANPEVIIALDNAPEVVEKYAQENINIKNGSAYKIPFPDESFEAIFSCWLYEHLANPAKAAQEMYRVLKKGGYFCSIVPSANSLLKGFYDDLTHIRPYTKVSGKQLAMLAGFADYKVEYLYWGRFQKQIAAILGEKARFKYLRLFDTVGRRLGIVNRYNLIIEAWK